MIDPLVLAFDPGLTGAFALVGYQSTLVDDLPVHQTQHGRSGKKRGELDLHALREELHQRPILHVFIERVAARPGQGVTSMFRFGEASGALYGLMVGLMFPVTFVTPQEWQKHHRVGASPDAARQRCCQLYPDLVASFARKRDNHSADALLLASYGRHMLNDPGTRGRLEQAQPAQLSS